MRLLNTVQVGMDAFIRRAEYEIKHAYPQPTCRLAATGPDGYIQWSWPSHNIALTVRLATKAVELWYPTGMFRIQAARNSKEVIQLFYMLFDLLGNDDQALRVLTEPYKGC